MTTKTEWVQSIDYSAGPLTSQNRRQYKPAVIRIPSLITVFTITLALIGLLEYGARVLPASQKGSKGDSIVPLGRRQASISSSSVETSSTKYGPSIIPTTSRGGYIDKASTTSTSYIEEDRSTIFYFPTQSSSGGYIDKSRSISGPGAAPPTDYVKPTVTLSSDVMGLNTATPAEIEATVTVKSTIGVSTSVFKVTSFSASTNINGQIVSVPVTQTSTSVVPVVTEIVGVQKVRTSTTIVTWPLWTVFVGNYLPVLVAAMFEIIWTAIFAKVKAVAPFVALTSVKGASVKDTLFPYFLSSNLTPTPIISFFKGHWLMLWTSLTYSVVTVLPALASESLFLDTNYCSNSAPDSTENRCWPPRLSINPTTVRIMQGLLTYVAIMSLSIAMMVRRARTGLFADNTSIAGVATLMHHPAVLQDFRSLDVAATKKEIKDHFKERRYALRDYQNQDGTWRYGMVPVDEHGVERTTVIREYGVFDFVETSLNYATEVNAQQQQFNHPIVGVEAIGQSPVQVTAPISGAKRNRWRVMTIILDLVFLAFIVGVLGMVVAYFKDGSNSGFNRFFNSNSFGPRFVMTAIGSIISLNWKRVQRGIQTQAPFRALARTPSPSAAQSILLQTHSLPITAIFPLLHSKHLLPAFISVVTVLADVLVITLSGVPWSPGHLYEELLVCSYTSMGVLALMAVALVLMLNWRKQLPYLPHDTDTVAGIMSYLAAGRLVEEMEGLEVRGTQERDRIIKGWGRSYYYGSLRGVDGIERWGIEGT